MTEKILNIAEPAYVLFSPLWSDKLTRMRLRKGTVVFSEIGREKLCTGCDEFWPADTEFFHTTTNSADGLNAWCKGCFLSWRREYRRQSKKSGG